MRSHFSRTGNNKMTTDGSKIWNERVLATTNSNYCFYSKETMPLQFNTQASDLAELPKEENVKLNNLAVKYDVWPDTSIYAMT